jgi:hypothetical protein
VPPPSSLARIARARGDAITPPSPSAMSRPQPSSWGGAYGASHAMASNANSASPLMRECRHTCRDSRVVPAVRALLAVDGARGDAAPLDTVQRSASSPSRSRLTTTEAAAERLSVWVVTLPSEVGRADAVPAIAAASEGLRE